MDFAQIQKQKFEPLPELCDPFTHQVPTIYRTSKSRHFHGNAIAKFLIWYQNKNLKLSQIILVIAIFKLNVFSTVTVQSNQSRSDLETTSRFNPEVSPGPCSIRSTQKTKSSSRIQPMADLINKVNDLNWNPQLINWFKVKKSLLAKIRKDLKRDFTLKIVQAFCHLKKHYWNEEKFKCFNIVQIQITILFRMWNLLQNYRVMGNHSIKLK